MDHRRLLPVLERVREGLDHGSTGAANQKKASENHAVSTAAARAKLKELETKRTASRTAMTKIDAKHGYPSVSTKR